MRYVDKTWYECTLDRISELTKGKGHFVLYDIGAGNGVLEDKVKAFGGQWTGFDYIPRKEGIIELNLEKDIRPELTNGNPDIILLLEVIEHLFNPGKAISNISMIAKKGTHLLITTPNPFWSIVRLKFLFLNKFPMFEKSDMLNNHHVFTVWPYVLEKLLVDNGFQIIDSYTIGQCSRFPKFSFTPQFIARIFVHLLRKLLEKISPDSTGMCYGFTAVKM